MPLYRCVKNLSIFLMFLFLTDCSQAVPDRQLKNEYGLPIQPSICNPSIYSVHILKNPPIIDGKGDDIGWKNISWSSRFSSSVDGSMQKTSFDTRFKIGVYKDSVYIFLKVYDESIWATKHQIDSRFFDDKLVNIYIDSNADEYDFLAIHLNPFGNVFGEFFERGNGNPLFRIDLGLDIIRCAVRVEGTLNHPDDKDEFWQAELALPMNFTYQKKVLLEKNDFWKMNVSRNIWQTVILSGQYKKVIDSESGKKILLDAWEWSCQWGNNIDFIELWGDCVFDKELLSNKSRSNLKELRKIKWELRNIYYAQNLYFEKHKRYAKKIADLRDAGFQISNLKFNPEIRARKSSFQALLSSPDNDFTFVVDSKGRIQKKPM